MSYSDFLSPVRFDRRSACSCAFDSQRWVILPYRRKLTRLVVCRSPHQENCANAYLYLCLYSQRRTLADVGCFFNQFTDSAKARGISAATQPADQVHPIVVDAMREVGIDLANARPQKLTAELARGADMLVTMGCGDDCPNVPGLFDAGLSTGFSASRTSFSMTGRRTPFRKANRMRTVSSGRRSGRRSAHS